MTAREIEVAIANHFDYRRNIIVPNVYWGMGFDHEADILVLSGAGYASEIEIKVSKADLLRDAKKRNRDHECGIVKAFSFAVPAELGECAAENTIPGCGIFTVEYDKRPGRYLVKLLRPPVLRKHSRKFTDAERYNLARLGLMRYWSMLERCKN